MLIRLFMIGVLILSACSRSSSPDDDKERIRALEAEVKQLKSEVEKKQQPAPQPRQGKEPPQTGAQNKQRPSESNTSNKSSLDLQEKCARQAQNTPARLGWRMESLSIFENHYNARLNKCFV